MAWCIHEIEEVALLSRVFHEDSERGAFEADLAIDLILTIISPFVLAVEVPALDSVRCLVRLTDNHVTQQSLATMQMTAEGHRPNQVRFGTHRCEELHRVVGLKNAAFINLEVCLFWRCDDRHIECLGILLLNKCFDTLTEHFLGIRVVLLILVEYDLLSVGEVVFISLILLIDLHHLLAMGG